MHVCSDLADRNIFEGGASIRETRREIINLLLSQEVSINETDAGGKSTIMMPYAPISLLLENGCGINQKYYYGNTALFYCLKDGSLSRFKELIECGAAVDVVNKHGEDLFKVAISEAEKTFALHAKNPYGELGWPGTPRTFRNSPEDYKEAIDIISNMSMSKKSGDCSFVPSDWPIRPDFGRNGS
ncbi:MAG: hypothetical protein HQL77_12985 [Magnetococcales bacterium]|nr:hypothetical protein [Magnetococcales bacterium]